MSASPSGSTDADTSDSESNHSSRVPSPPSFQGPPAASTRSKRSLAQSTASPVPASLPPQPPSASTRAKKLSVQSTKSYTPTKSNTPTQSSAPTKPWLVQSTKSRILPNANAISSVPSFGQSSKVTTLSSDVEVVKTTAESGQPPKPTGANHVKSSDSPPAPEPARLISRKTFEEATGHAFNCRSWFLDRYQGFLRELDPKASHYKHLKEPPTVETSLPQLLQAVTYENSAGFFKKAKSRRFWETVKDLHKTEGLVFKTLTCVDNTLTTKSHFDKSEADMILGQLTTVNIATEAFCTRMSARLTLTAEQSTIFGENDLTYPQLLYFRLAGTDNLPSVEQRFRLLWAIYPIHDMRARFHAWNQALSGNNATLKAMLETVSATIEGVESETRGTKRKAEDDDEEDEDENEQ
ncbi:hypothetical protein KCV07_g3310, partial [Aureobasidium melanogenum]